MGASGSKSGPSHTAEELLNSLEEDGDHTVFVRMVACNRKVAKRILRDRNGDTGLHIMAQRGMLVGLIETFALVVRGHEREKGSPLTGAEVARICYKLSNARNDRGRTPLMLASKGGSEDVVGFLLEHYGNVWLHDRMGGAHAVHYAASAGKDGCVALLVEHAKTHRPPSSTMQPVPLLEVSTVNGFTPLHYAAWHKRPTTIARLSELGANLYARSDWGTIGNSVPCNAGSTPLHMAAMSGSLRTVKAIIQVYAMALSEAEEQARSSGQAPHSVLDPRLVQDRQGCLAFAIAMQRGNTRLLPVLHPLTALNEIFAGDQPDERQIGAPRLIELVAMVAQRVLIAELEACEKAIAAYHQHQHAEAAGLPERPIRLGSGLASPPTASGVASGATAGGAFAAAVAVATAASALIGTPHATQPPAALALPGTNTGSSSVMAGAGHAGSATAFELPSRVLVQMATPFGALQVVDACGIPDFSRSPTAAAGTAAATNASEDDDEGIAHAAPSGSAGASTDGATPGDAPPPLRQGGAGGLSHTTLAAASAPVAGPPDAAGAAALVAGTPSLLGSQASLGERRGAWRARLQQLPRSATLHYATDGTGEVHVVPPHTLTAATAGEPGEGVLVFGDSSSSDDDGGNLGASRRTRGKDKGRGANSVAGGEAKGSQRGWLGRRRKPAAGTAQGSEGGAGTGASTAAAAAGVCSLASLGKMDPQRQHSVTLALLARQDTVLNTKEWQARAAALLKGGDMPSELTPVAAAVLQLLGLGGMAADGDGGVAAAGSSKPETRPLPTAVEGSGASTPSTCTAAGSATMAAATSADSAVVGAGASVLSATTSGEATKEPEHLQDGDLPGSLSHSQINAAIHMVRMHRLREGMQEVLAEDMAEDTIPEAEDETDESVATVTTGLARLSGTPLGPSAPSVVLVRPGAGAGAALRPRPSVTAPGGAGGPLVLSGALSRMNSLARTSPVLAPAPVVELHRHASSNGQHMVIMRSGLPLAGPSALATTCSRHSSQQLVQLSPGMAAALMATATATSNRLAATTSVAVSPGGAVTDAADVAQSASAGAVAPTAAPLPRTASTRSTAVGTGGVQQVLTRVLTLLRTATIKASGTAAVAGVTLDDEGEEETCGVCLDTGTYVAIKGCSHRLCVVCAKELVRLHELKPALCPFCRHIIQGFTPVFNAPAGAGAACPLV